MTELVLTLDRPPRALSGGARAVLALLVLLAGCGQKGPLVLPAAKAAPAPASAAAAAPGP